MDISKDVRAWTRSMTVVKWVLLSFNLLVMLAGLLLIGFGGAARAHAIPTFNSDSLAAGLIVVGVLIFLLSFLGLWGTIRENRRVLIVYFAFVLFFVIVEFAVGIAAIVLRNDLPVLLDPLWTTVRNTDDQAILTIETQFQCCGYTNTYDRAVPPYVTTVPLTPTCMGIHTENGFPTYIGGCASEIFQFIKLSNNVSEAAKLQQEHGCCGYYDVNDPSPFGVIYDDTDSPVNCAQTNPTWPTCVSSLQTQFYSTRNANGNASAVNDEWVMHEQDEYRCCGWLNDTDAAVPPYYNQTCVGIYHYSKGCQQAVVDTLTSSIGVVGGIGIAIAVIQIVALILAIFLVRKMGNRKSVIADPVGEHVEMKDEDE